MLSSSSQLSLLVIACPRRPSQGHGAHLVSIHSRVGGGGDGGGGGGGGVGGLGVGGGGNSGSILKGCVNTNLKGMGPFFSFMGMKGMDKFPFKMGLILAWSFNMGTFCFHFPFSLSHIFNSRTTIYLAQRAFFTV